MKKTQNDLPLQIDNLSFRYQRRAELALDELSFSINPDAWSSSPDRAAVVRQL